MLEYLKNKRILVVAAHPDDELLGQGATIHRLVNEFNCNCRAVILGEGLTSRSEKREREKWEKELKEHRDCIYKAADIIGYESVGIYDFSDNRFDSVDLLDLIKVVEKEKKGFQPEIILTHHSGDLNIDHQRTFEAVMTATRPIKNEVVKAIIAFETPSSTEWNFDSESNSFSPNLFSSLDETDIVAKCSAMECYEFEKRDWPHPRSSKALKIRAEYWGMVIGCDFAEPLRLIRGV